MTEDFIDGFEAATSLVLKRLADEDVEATRRYLQVILETLNTKKAGY